MPIVLTEQNALHKKFVQLEDFMNKLGISVYCVAGVTVITDTQTNKKAKLVDVENSKENIQIVPCGYEWKLVEF